MLPNKEMEVGCAAIQIRTVDTNALPAWPGLDLTLQRLALLALLIHQQGQPMMMSL